MHVVIAGGGVAAVEAALALRDLAGDRVSMTLVSPRPDFVLTPMAVGEPFSAGHAGRRHLEALADEIGIGVVAGAVTRVRRDDHTVELTDGSELGYDVLLLAPGARPVAAYGHVHTFAAEDDPTALSGLIADLEEGWSHSVAFVVPPGVTWPLPAYELALLTARDVRAMGLDDVTITLITPETRPLDVFGTGPATPSRASSTTWGSRSRARRRPTSGRAGTSSSATGAPSTRSGSSRWRCSTARGSRGCRETRTASSRSTATRG